MADLILVNGPPGVGKSTLARRFADDHPLTLHLEIDDVRVALGAWQDHEASKLLARDLAVAMADAHLRAGHDVVVAQYLGRVEFIETLDELAQRVGVDFVEVVVLDDEPVTVERFRARRAELVATALAHPEADLDDASVEAAIADAFARLRTIAASRPRTRVVSASDGIERAYEALRAAVRDGGT